MSTNIGRPLLIQVPQRPFHLDLLSSPVGCMMLISSTDKNRQSPVGTATHPFSMFLWLITKSNASKGVAKSLTRHSFRIKMDRGKNKAEKL
jgi:hypothetical protein